MLGVDVNNKDAGSSGMLRRTRAFRAGLALGASLLLAACGGGGGGAAGGDGADAGSGASLNSGSAQAVVEMPASREQAARFLTQATFGPTDADIDRVMAIGYGAWIDEQLAKPATSHRAAWEAADAAAKAANPSSGAGQDQVLDSFWKQAIRGEDQLRQRAAYALSQIFIISMMDDNVGGNPRAVAAWLDMLGDKGLGSYRDLLETVSRHPLMGQYLSHLRNQKADPKTGRVPDENYAREVMQLFSIGLVALNADGSARSDGSKPLETYDQADIAGLAKVFTGWSWACPEWPDNNCFFWGSANDNSDRDRNVKSMLGYPQYHSPEEKKFLGATIPAQSQSDPQASLRVALDTLAAHPNVGPFIGKQLIQRLVTSNPSPQYVAAVAAAFNGSGGDMKAMLRAVLMHPEARSVSASAGKVREPVLRLSAYLRAFDYQSDSGNWRVGNTDSTSGALGQTPLRSPSVFNFYRPGYVPPGTEAAEGAGPGPLLPPLLVLTARLVHQVYSPPARPGHRLDSRVVPPHREVAPCSSNERGASSRPAESPSKRCPIARPTRPRGSRPPSTSRAGCSRKCWSSGPPAKGRSWWSSRPPAGSTPRRWPGSSESRTSPSCRRVT
jgi:uncharacterized protein (DUF1800 family)